jgi:hypothetical protein
MANELLLPLIALIVLTLWLAARHVLAFVQGESQREIARSGASCQGRVVAIQRPFLLDACTRLYFDFVPEGRDRPVRVCHVDRRPLTELHASLPVAGASVAVRYLPHRPRRAVICKLVSMAASH